MIIEEISESRPASSRTAKWVSRITPRATPIDSPRQPRKTCAPVKPPSLSTRPTTHVRGVASTPRLRNIISPPAVPTRKILICKDRILSGIDNGDGPQPFSSERFGTEVDQRKSTSIPEVGEETDTNDVELENLSDNESTSDDSDVGDLLDIVRIDPNCPKHGQHKQEHLQEQQQQKLAPPRPAQPSQNNQSDFREYRIPKIWRPCIAELGEEVRKCDVPVTKREKAVRPAEKMEKKVVSDPHKLETLVVLSEQPKAEAPVAQARVKSMPTKLTESEMSGCQSSSSSLSGKEYQMGCDTQSSRSSSSGKDRQKTCGTQSSMSSPSGKNSQRGCDTPPRPILHKIDERWTAPITQVPANDTVVARKVEWNVESVVPRTSAEPQQELIVERLLNWRKDIAIEETTMKRPQISEGSRVRVLVEAFESMMCVSGVGEKLKKGEKPVTKAALQKYPIWS